jgi:hypothetical protein
VELTHVYVQDVSSDLQLDHGGNGKWRILSIYMHLYLSWAKDQRDFIVLVEHLKRGCFMSHSPLFFFEMYKRERQHWYGLVSPLYVLSYKVHLGQRVGQCTNRGRTWHWCKLLKSIWRTLNTKFGVGKCMYLACKNV